MKPEKGSHLPKLPSRSSRSENPAPPSNPSMALDAGGGTPTSGGLSYTYGQPSSAQSLPPSLPAS